MHHFVLGLKLDNGPSKSSLAVNVNEKAKVKCPAFEKVLNLDGAYDIVYWEKCPLKGDFDDGTGCNWIAGRNRQGKTQSKEKRFNISSDGALQIKKVQLSDAGRYKCTVERINHKSPKRHFTKLTVNRNGKK